MSVVRPREVPLGGLRAMTVRRTLPNRERTTIGAWCFLDHFGPDHIADTGGMSVAPHPHTGLQTVSWLFSGEIEHRDSVGSRQLIAPGQLNLMTAGRGIAHSEISTLGSDWVHGVQLWVALPDEHRHVDPFFEHVAAPRVNLATGDGNGQAIITVFVGALLGVESAATTFSPLMGAEIVMPAQSSIKIPVDHDFEHGILIDQGTLVVNGERGEETELLYLGSGAKMLNLSTHDAPVRAVLVGGLPFDEQLVMWWNFIARSHEEVVALRDEWQRDVIDGLNPGGRFGRVDFEGPSIPAPAMPKVRLRARGPIRP